MLAAAILLALDLLAGLLGVLGDEPLLTAGMIMLSWAALTLAAAMAPGSQIAHARKSVTGFLLLAALPAALVVFQLLPIPALAHSIWQSVAVALGPTLGSVTVDTTLTIRNLAVYLSMVAAVTAAAMLAVDKVRASFMIWMLAVIVTPFALMARLFAVLGRNQSGLLATARYGATVDALTEFGFLLCGASLLAMFIDRQGSFNWRGFGSSARAVGLLCGFVLAALSLLGAGSPGAYVSTGCAVLLFGGIACAHVMRLRLWELRALTLSVVTACAILVAAGFQFYPLMPAQGHNLSPDASAIVRLTADAGLLGTGAGTYSSLLRIYGGAADAARFAGSSGTLLLVEYGSAGLALLVLVALGACCWLVLRALKRGRNWHYAALAAACIFSGVAKLFTGASLDGVSYLSVLALITGVGVGQSFGSGRLQIE